MAQEKTGLDATPRIGLDLGRQIFDDLGGGACQEGQSGPSEERIRERAYEIWESEGRSADPQDHWHRAERELSEVTQEQSEPTLDDARSAKASPGVAQVGNRKVPRPNR